ncbi:hypothetical protein PDE_08653 [Penicillium oxalicum 114-2]|uniref:CAP-Gly domain-containing protein n=1 Tax=Penicillium oxalicum (strain 114-2 / CGMCC 5302) TaxID=933388 RepID=S7ZY05_PENO1|nr:hypothetical protein PDE_08653 [Penicillium oxalicum 114-2]
MVGQDFSPGTVVVLTDGRQATVRFIGLTHFANGEWIGVELTEPTGKNDGEVQGERYFQCEPGFGMFIRPTAIASILQQPSRQSKQTARPGSSANTGRQSQAGNHAGVRNTGIPPQVVAKRQSTTTAGNPPSVTKVSSRPSLRSPTKSPTKQLVSSATSSNRSSIGGAPRTSAVAPNRPRLASTTRSSASSPASQPAAQKASRPSISGSATRPSRSGTSNSSLSKRPSLRQVNQTKAMDVSDAATSGASDGPTDAESLENDEGSPRREEATASPARAAVSSPRPSRPSLSTSRSAGSRPSVPPSGARQVQTASAAARELEELQTRLRVMEKKRSDDREKLKMLEQLQVERDKFESIIQKLQAKYQPQQMEITELRKTLKDTQDRLEQLERMEAEHESLMEMATLDREMAEETAEAYKHECETLRLKLEELQLEVEVLREENEEFGQVTSPEERSSQGWLQMEKTNQRLREALLRLRDMTQQQESDLKAQIKELEEDLEEYAAVKADYEATKEKLLVAETNVQDLKQQLDTALGAEEMIEELADKNLRYQEEINELKAAIEDLEALREISDELETTHIETEKQLQDEIDYRDTVFTEQLRKIAQQDETIEDLEYTLSRFRELVTNLQGDLEDMRTSQQITEAEATDLTHRSRAMMDLNMKLQASVSKAQTKSIDMELGRMDAEEAAQHLAIVRLYLPEYFEEEKNSVLALLRFKRVSFKANMMNNTVRERISEQSSISSHEEMVHAHEVSEQLLWIWTVCDRFIKYINSCSTEEFGKIRVALFEMEPVERTLNFWIDNLKKNEISCKKFSVELHRSIALLSHLSETLIPSTPEMFVEELCMRSSLCQSYFEHMSAVAAWLKSFMHSKLLASASTEEAEGNEEATFALKQLDFFISQSRGYKVAMGKVFRSLDDLRSRSLALSKDADEPFQKMETSTKQLSELTRKICESVIALTSDEGRTEAFSLAEIIEAMSSVTASFSAHEAAPSEPSDPLTLLANKVREMAGALEELDAIAADLSQTTEFERRPFPWVARSEELKSNKTTSPDADEEIRRLKNEVHEISTALGVKDNTLEEQSIKIELLESRMREASKKAAMVKDLEARIEEVQTMSAEMERTVDSQKKELLSIEAERNDFKARLERMKRMSGTAGVAAANGGLVIDSEASLAAMQENESLRAEVQSLQAAVRFLREENRRSNLMDPYSIKRTTDMHAWLDAPLTRSTPTPEQEKVQRTAFESRDILTHLLRLTRDSRVCDLKSSIATTAENEQPPHRATWRPSKSRLRYQTLQQREQYEHWAEWRNEIVNHEREQDRIAMTKKDRALRENVPRREHKMSVDFPHGMTHGVKGRTWQVLGMQNGHPKVPVASEVGFEGVKIHSSD